MRRPSLNTSSALSTSNLTTSPTSPTASSKSTVSEPHNERVEALEIDTVDSVVNTMHGRVNSGLKSYLSPASFVAITPCSVPVELPATPPSPPAPSLSN
ncbi:hypothetical protein M422DRAFT_269842 [Sphaerobolus stellatus SS14]|uniref:Uncharacterized protein n=1 Tax=Sphaerobolus stellatus (strain SS14) TaxID=990650 RepID=A0A0C9UIQ0_SPHS4|nr:hypothetical protein M422DRAFT_269842 [Sphaerobolus stellatus SS14]